LILQEKRDRSHRRGETDSAGEGENDPTGEEVLIIQEKIDGSHRRGEIESTGEILILQKRRDGS
jgi:hypothetical protein